MLSQWRLKKTYIPVKVYPELDEKKIMGSLYALIEAKFHQKIGNAIQQMEQLLLPRKIVNIYKSRVRHQC